ncbi:leucyl aminopeptidase [Ornithinimicrobium faecis]|uniref:Probable cytosol aminopeptidase n=1 Tax=Ornithinimicrobium faecis TaxID=2934158 RepID=A0ABY4YXX7_9MICO|nr:leucyl aminopeptidase [Ornithinimicrobium sp. HY1793]USQ81628.1 leucyl aminopeptidase [Ornithinimicrobium sp. HY1793]
MTTLTLTDSRIATAKVDALVLASTAGEDGALLAEGTDLPKNAVTHITKNLSATGASGKADEVVKLAGVPGVAAGLVLVVGTGKPTSGRPSDSAPHASERHRRAAGAAVRALAGKDSAVFALGGGAEEARAVAEGVLLGGYAFQTFLGEGKAASAKAPLASAQVYLKGRHKEDIAGQSATVADAVRYARDLVNTPPNVLFPESFAHSVSQHAAGTKVKIDVWDTDKLQAEGCGGILGVGQGSGRPPRLVTMTYKPRGAKVHLAFVGKGITFDSGGLCIKPGTGMVTMKCDMAGAAAVAASILALAELKVPVAVTGYLCLAENMTGDLAQRPGDIVTMRGGRTVEIINTDAEGRLVMADGIALASEQQPDAIVDIATLTGACVIALGNRTMGVMANDDDLRERVTTAATGAGEAAWGMPLPEEIRGSMDSPVADLKHTGDRAGGMMVAAKFLEEFVGKDAAGEAISWSHVDIAGPGFNEKGAWGYTPTGGTGSGVRALIELARSYA